LSCYGATKISTPAIDSLAREGMKFNKAYVTSSLCSPSRYSLLTGEYSWRSRLKYGVIKYYEKPLISQDQMTLASMLKQNGYTTACVGKWHLGLDWPLKQEAMEEPGKQIFDTWQNGIDQYVDFTKQVQNGPIALGFDYFYGIAGSNNMQPYVIIENDQVTMAPSVQDKAYDHYNAALRAPNWKINTLNMDFTNKAVDVIDSHFRSDSEKPLFLYFPTSAIHRPSLPTFTKGKSQAGLRGDIVEELDWTVAQVVKALKTNNALENTLLIFTSDNGPRAGDPAFWMEEYESGEYEDFHQDYFDEYQPELVNEDGNKIWKKGWYTYGHSASGNFLGFKSDAWEGGLRVPFIAHWPGKINPGISDNIICNVDIYATIADMLDLKIDDGQAPDSYSFLSNLLGEDVSQVRESLVISGGASGAMVAVKDDWKYIEASEEGRWPQTFYPEGPSIYDEQLYRLDEDVFESNNRLTEYPEIVKDLKKLIGKVQSGGGTEASIKLN